MRAARTVYVALGLEASLEAVMERVLARHRSSSCPLHEQRQWETAVREGVGPKVRKLVASLEPPLPEELQSRGVTVLQCGGLPTPSEIEDLLWQLVLTVSCPVLLRAGPPAAAAPAPSPAAAGAPRVAL